MPERDIQLPLIAEAGALIMAPEPFVVFELPGEPRAWGRARAQIRKTREGKPFIHFFMDGDEAHYRESLKWLAKAALRARQPTSRPVTLLVHAYLPIPKDWTMREKADARAGVIRPASKPDADNFGKIVGDSLNEIVWDDDAQIVDLRVIKRYSDKPALRVEVREMVPPNAA
jgi:Holliday junction resolvase RusA-like endonuclease